MFSVDESFNNGEGEGGGGGANNEDNNSNYPEIMRITLVELQFSIYEGNQAKDIFIKAPRNVESLDLKIFFEDFMF